MLLVLITNIPPNAAKRVSGNPVVTSWQPGLRPCGFVTVGGFLFSCHLDLQGRETGVCSSVGPFGHPYCTSHCVSARDPCCSAA